VRPERAAALTAALPRAAIATGVSVLGGPIGDPYASLALALAMAETPEERAEVGTGLAHYYASFLVNCGTPFDPAESVQGVSVEALRARRSGRCVA
jgi:hypothetical protein